MKEIHINEYRALKDEQARRITHRENLFYISMGVAGAIISTSFSEKGLSFGLISLTPVLFILQNSYYSSDEKISHIGRYIREHLAHRVASLDVGWSKEDIFFWECYHRQLPRRSWRRLLQLIANLMLYPGASLASVYLFVHKQEQLEGGSEILVWFCGLLTLVMLVEALLFSEIVPRRRG